MNNNQIKILFWNARGIANKIEELKKYLYRHQIDVVGVCETFMRGDRSTKIKGYNTVFLNRINGRFGGLAIFIKENIKFNVLKPVKLNLFEYIGINVLTTNNNQGLNIIQIYLPGQKPDREISDHMYNDLTKLTTMLGQYIIVGDFNSRSTHWNCISGNKAGAVLRKFTDNTNTMLIYPREHTYCPVANVNHSTIDLILTDGKYPITDPFVVKDFYSDHYPVQFSIITQNIKRGSDKQVFCYRQANWKLFREVLQKEIEKIPLRVPTSLNFRPVIDTLVQHLIDITTKARDHSVPKVKVGKDNIMIDNETKDLIKIRNYYQRRYLKYRDNNDKDLHKHLKYIVENKLKTIRAEDWNRKLSQGNRNGNIYKLIGNRKRVLSLPSLSDKGEPLTSEQEKADDLATSFAKAHNNVMKNCNKKFTRQVEMSNKLYIDRYSKDTSNPQTVTVQEVSNVIKNLKNGKSPGHDNITNKMIKNFGYPAITLLTHIFNYCLKFHYFPLQWKKAIVVPIKKPGKDGRLSTGYRPISLLCGFSKVFEKLIAERLVTHVNENNILPPEQYGFIKGKSTNHQLINVHNYISNNLKVQNSIGMLCLDVEKAFDCVWHQGLIYKLIQYKFDKGVVLIINSFLMDRSFNVKVNDVLSQTQYVPFGVPQGSVLSPHLYNIYTADIPRPDDSKMSLFADDTAIFTASRYAKTISKRLKTGFSKIEKHFSKWKIKINGTKTNSIFFTTRKKKQLPMEPIPLKNNICIQWSKKITYLGLTFTPNLRYDTHIDSKLDKIDTIIRMLYPIICRGSHTPTETKILIYKLYIRPVLTYGHPLIIQSNKKMLKKLQTKQNKILRLLLNKPFDYNTQKLHRESAIEPIIDFITKLNTNFENRLLNQQL